MTRIILGVFLIMNGFSLYGKEGFSFLFLGDLHYHSPEYCTAQMVNEIAKDIRKKNIKIDFVCHIGDLIENQRRGQPVSLEEGAQEWKYAIKDIRKNFDVPFFMALGNHDWYGDNTWFGGWKNIKKYYIPFMSQELGRPLNGKPFFSFRWENSLFLFTNHEGYNIGLDKEQRIWLKKTLAGAENNPAIEHVFIFGHPNLWNFSYFRFNENYGLLDIISKSRKVDAYFCGHTHHNNASVWDFRNGKKLLQINGSPKGLKNTSPYSIGEHELILNPPPSHRGYAKGLGYLYAYFIVSVDGSKVNVSLESIGGDKLWEFSWIKPGEIKEKLFLGRNENKTLKKDQLKDIKEARLHIFPYVPERILHKPLPICIELNGTKIAELPRMRNGWELSRYHNFISAPPKLIKIKNKIAISNPNNERFAVRDCYLEVILKDGKRILTPVYPYVLFAGDWRDIYMDFGLCHPTKGVLYSSVEANIPEELIKCTKIGKKIIVDLNFNSEKIN